jgi:hypothetical protein
LCDYDYLDWASGFTPDAPTRLYPLKDTPKVHSISLKRVLLTFLLLAGTDAIAQTTAMVVGLLARRSG